MTEPLHVHTCTRCPRAWTHCSNFCSPLIEGEVTDKCCPVCFALLNLGAAQAATVYVETPKEPTRD